MDENTPVLQTNNPPKAKQNPLRTTVMVFLQIANVSFCIMMGYLLITFLLNAFGVGLDKFFGYEGLDSGFFESIGVLMIGAIIILAAITIAVTVGFVASNQKYYNVLKIAKTDNMHVALAPTQTIASCAWMVLAIVLMGFVCLYFAQNGIVSLTSILLYISIAALTLAFVFTIVLCIINQTMFNKLSDSKKAEVRESSKQFEKKIKKAERNRTAGKLY